MTTKREIKPTHDASTGESLRTHCIDCDRLTNHVVLASHMDAGEEWDVEHGWSVQWNDHYQVIQCQGCESMSFRHEHWDDQSCIPEIGESGITEQLYPKRETGTLGVKPLLNVPNSLRRLYGEVIESYNNDSATLCAAGLRALVEGLCANQGVDRGPVSVNKAGGAKTVNKKNLEGKISGLAVKGLLTKSSADTLHEHRFLGNEALHELARPSNDELKAAIEILEHTLEQIYEIPEKVRSLRDLRARDKK